MKLTYFPDTDTLYIEFRPCAVAETRDLDDDTLIDVDDEGNLCGLTIEHASARANSPEFSYAQVQEEPGWHGPRAARPQPPAAPSLSPTAEAFLHHRVQECFDDIERRAAEWEKEKS